MNRNCSPLLLACLGACATTTVKPGTTWSRPTVSGLPTFSSMEPADAPTREQPSGLAPDKTMLPVGVGFTTGPYSTMLGATLDFPLDTKLTFGPSLQWGFDNDANLFAASGQLKFFPSKEEGDAEQSTFLPYLTGGVGIAAVDKKGRSRDTGLLLNVGAGVRYLTGENYRIGSEARLNILPDKLAGEYTFLSFELLQIVITF